MSNREVRLSLDRAEVWILDHPVAPRRWRRDDGVVVDGNEPGVLLAYEETDSDTVTWVEWLDLWERGD